MCIFLRGTASAAVAGMLVLIEMVAGNTVANGGCARSA
jgi:hypothetical protein